MVIVDSGCDLVNKPFYSCLFSYLALNGNEAADDLVLIKTSLLLLCKSSCSYANAAFKLEKQRVLYQSNVISNLACIYRPGN